jgi:hypothetical protein
MATCLYRESRLNLDPAHSKSTIDILVPASSTSAFSSRPSPKRRRLNDAAPVYDEKTFQNGHLASDASIYFRPSHHELTKGRGPRAILWRVLEEGTVLELQAVDLWQDDDTREPDLTLRVSFSGTIRPHGVTFAERKAEGSSPHAVAFVLTTSGELFTLDLRREVFIKSEVEVSTWCARSSIGALSSRNPFKLFASSDDELWASLGDGSLLRLDRKQGISGSKWQETYYAERGWRTSVRGLGGLIAWKGIVKARFGDVELYAGTAVSMALSPDSKYMWTACLDHTVKAWDVGTGKLAFNADLVGDTNRDLQRPVDHLLNPQHSELLRILPSRVIDEYTVVTFSPHTRQFKFWTIRDLEHAEHGVEDMRPDLRLIPPIEDMTETAIWSIETFHVSPPQASGDTWSLWLLVRCGARCSTFNLKFRMDSHVDALAKAWEENWTGVDCGSNTVDHLKEHSDALERIASTGEDVVTQWCDFLFYPGRFSLSTLETAVTVFRSSLGRNAMKRSSNNMGSLKERLCEIVGLSCELTHSHDGTPAYEKYQQDIANQWRTFYGVVRDLHKRRSDSLTLAFNPELDAPWLVMADQVAPLREASECELLWLNRDVPPEDLHADSILVRALRGTEAVEVAKLFYAIDIFRQNLPAQFVRKFSRVINTEILQSLDASDEHIELSHDLEAIYEKSGFLNQVSDDDYNQLTDALKPLGGIAKIVSDMILSVLDFLEEARQGSPQRRTLTRYGARAMSRGSQEILELGSEILLDCLLLVVFMGAELEEGDLSQSFDAASIFAALMHRAKQYHFLSWLASTVIVIESEPKPSVSDTSSNTALALINDAVETNDSSITILEFMCLGDWSVMETLPVTSQARALTYWSRALTLGMNLSKSYTFIACHIMASFIKLEEARLAFEFMKFLPETPWSVYLQARLYLIAGQTDTAARLFQSAGLDLVNSKYFDADLEDPASLLDMDDREHFNEGLARYYQHVVKVFDNEHCMSYVAEFTELGLEAYEEEGTEVWGNSKRTSHDILTVLQQDPKLKNDLLCRQIQASLAICRFDTTCAALARLSDAAL